MTPAGARSRTTGELAALRMVRSIDPARRLAKVLFALFVTVVATLVFAPWVQNVDGHGRVIAYAPVERRQNIDAPVEGRILRWHVRDGAIVHRGDPIVDISDNDPLILDRLRSERTSVLGRIESLRGRIASLGDRIVSLEAARRQAMDGAARRVRMAEQRVQAAARSVDAARAAFRTSTLNRDRQAHLVREGLVSQRTAEIAELDYVRTSTDQARAEAALEAARSEQAALEADRQRVAHDTEAALNDARATQSGANAEVASSEAELARLEVRLARQQTMAVTAPRDGTLVRIMVPSGNDLVKAGDPLALFVPDTNDRAVELLVDGNDAPLLAPGRHVRVQFEGWPAIQFSGWPSVAVGTFGGTVAVVDAADDGNGKFRVLVLPDGGPDAWPNARFLRQGVRANGWILLNSVPLGYELWRQFNGFPPVVATSQPGAPAGAPAGSGK